MLKNVNKFKPKNIGVKLVSQCLLKKIHKAFPRTQDELYKSQKKSWVTNLEYLQGTEIFKDLELGEVKTYDDYIKNVRASDYDDFSPYIERMIKGETNILTNQEPFHFLLTSGSSGKHAKKIPYNRPMFKNYQLAQKQLGASIYAQSGLNVSGVYLFNYAAKSFCYQEGAYKFGYVSGLLKEHISRLYKQNNLPSLAVIQEDDWKKKVDMIMDETLSVNIEAISSVPLYVVKIFEEMLKKSGKKKINEIWPNLKVFSYGGTPIDRYKDRINELVGHELTYYGIYVSSESPLGIGRSAYDGRQYYYFLPQVVYSFTDHLDGQSCYGVHEVVDQGEYFIQISGAHGLIKYQMKDRVRIHIKDEEIFFEILGRDEDGLNLATEKIPHNVIDQSLSKVKDVWGLGVDHFFVSPTSKDGEPCYHWTFFCKNVGDYDGSEVLETFEKEICRLREDYKSCRDDQLLASPKLTLRTTESLDKYFTQNSKKGQFKMKTLFHQESEFDEFLEKNFE